MDTIAIHFKEDKGLPRSGEPASFGVAIAEGRAYSGNSFALSKSKTGGGMSFEIQPLTYWPDGSLHWIKISTLLEMEPWQELTLFLMTGEDNLHIPERLSLRPVQLDEAGDGLRIETGPLRARVYKDDLRWVVTQGAETDKLDLRHKIVMKDENSQPCQAKLSGSWSVIEHNKHVLTLVAQGEWYRLDGSLLARFDCVLQFLANSDTVAVDTRIHNPRRALHSGGLWDLGDPGSIHFSSLEIVVEAPGSGEARMRPEILSKALSVESSDGIRLYQDSSGGKHWDSRNHLDAEQKPSVRFRGYQVYTGDAPHTAGDRATPIASLLGPSGSVHASVKHFWQNFPTALSAQGDRLTIGLFPDGSAKPYELQGGERKTQTAYLNYGTDPDALLWTQAPLVPVIEPRHYEQAGVFPWFRAGMAPGPLDALIQGGLEGPENFFVKREMIDEYGWRNFGEVFADHETHYQKPGEAPLISHYNNQYDAIYGFARQFALTGDRRWFELMDDLARHVTDIDIYHTVEDRAEYNGGLFWHTDHYLDAHTATHRTFTRHNDTSSTPGQTGGGPASEHCYTSGLLYHYYLTGVESSREAVLQLANWMTAAHEGQGGLLEQLLALKKNELPKLKALAKGEKPLAHRYPFTRGTGNYLNALLDAWLLEPEERWLQRAESVIRDTIHPDDDIDQRKLLTVETGWSYLILLASLARYLGLKEEVGDKDDCYRYALESFLRYTEWMRKNERPFLTDSEQLEFPNDTWVAQDIRKAMLMFQAANYRTNEADAYYAKGCEWLEYVCGKLEDSPEAGYARILIILMQNYGPQHLESGMKPLPEGLSFSRSTRPPVLTWPVLISRVGRRLLRGIRTFRPGREKAWLNARLERP